MATIGKTSAGATLKVAQEFCYGILYTMSEDGDLSTIHVSCSSDATGNATAGVIDNDGTAGAPGTLLKDSDNQNPSTSQAWTTFTLDSTLSLLNADSIYLCVHHDNTTNNGHYYDAVGSYTVYRINSAYTSGTIAVPDTVYNSDHEMSIYATYTPSASGRVMGSLAGLGGLAGAGGLAGIGGGLAG